MNVVGMGRTNYFHVKDADAFRAAVAALDGALELVEDKRGFALFPSDEGVFPTFLVRDDQDDVEEFDVAEFLRPHLARDSIAIVIEAGFEGQRYAFGHAHAVAPLALARDDLHIDLNDIYRQAERAFGLAAIEPARG